MKKFYKKCQKPPPQTELEKYIGKVYVLDRSENYENFLRELGVRTNVRTKAMTSKPTVMLTKEKDDFVLSTMYPEGRLIKVKFKPGKEIRRCGASRRRTTSLFQAEDNKITEEQFLGDRKVLIEREFNKKDLLVTMEVDGVKCYRFYNLVEDSKSIATETSRRSYLWHTDVDEDSVDTSGETITSVTSESVEEEIEENLCY